jgi:hypothetical protein
MRGTDRDRAGQALGAAMPLFFPLELAMMFTA